MKTIYFNIQTKGGSGKSMLTYIQALKREQDKDWLFVDLDNSTKTSKRQLSFLAEQRRVIAVDIMDSTKRIEREKVFGVLEKLVALPFNNIIMDFGAPESEQLPNVFSIDYSVDEFKDFATGLDAQFIFNVVVAGGPAYTSCMEYAREVITVLEGKFEVFLYVNEYTFQHNPELIEEVKQYAETKKELVKGVRPFGNIYVERESGRNIMDNVKHGKGFSEYTGWATKINMRKELEKV